MGESSFTSATEKVLKTRKMSFNSDHETLVDPELLGYPRLSNASNISTTSNGSRPTPRLATRPGSRPEPLNYVVPREEPIVQSAVSPDNNNSCGCGRGKCSSVLKCLAIFPILAIIFGITLVPCYILAKEVIIQDKATFDEIVQKYKFEVFVTWFSMTLLLITIMWSIYTLTLTFFEYQEVVQKMKENQKRRKAALAN